MDFKIFLSLSILLFLTGLTHARQPTIRWKLFKGMYNKTYTASEDATRRAIWEDNFALIENHNRLADKGKYSYWLKMNQFGDLTEDEVHSTLYGLDVTVNISQMLKYRPLKVDLPKHVDWRTKGCVTEVKYQGQCGACYAFATTGALEGQHARKYDRLVSLSEQNIIDCSRNYGNKGCHGGNMDKAFAYVIANRGIDTEKAYPYVGKDESCHFKKRVVGSSCSAFVDIPTGSELDLQEAVAMQGPVAVGVDAKHYEFRFYDHGVFDYPKCSPTKLSHAMLVVGYGTADVSEGYGVGEGRDYWEVKNSWGLQWGENGYVRMSRNRNNQCGIASMASYPVL